MYESNILPNHDTHTCVFPCRDLERIEAPVYSVKAHESIINAIDGCGGLGIGGGAPELVTGSRDGKSLLCGATPIFC